MKLREAQTTVLPIDCLNHGTVIVPTSSYLCSWYISTTFMSFVEYLNISLVKSCLYLLICEYILDILILDTLFEAHVFLCEILLTLPLSAPVFLRGRSTTALLGATQLEIFGSFSITGDILLAVFASFMWFSTNISCFPHVFSHLNGWPSKQLVHALGFLILFDMLYMNGLVFVHVPFILIHAN